MVARHFLDEAAFLIFLEDHEVAQDVQQAIRCEHPLDERFQFRPVVQIDTIDRAPGFEPLEAAGQGAEPRLGARAGRTR